MLGCMVETSLGISAAAQISGLVDFVDLDGAMLLADDPTQDRSTRTAASFCPRSLASGRAAMIVQGLQSDGTRSGRGWFANRSAKTAHGLVRYGKDRWSPSWTRRSQASVCRRLADLGRDAQSSGRSKRRSSSRRPPYWSDSPQQAGGPAEWMETLRQRQKRARDRQRPPPRLAPEFPAKPVWDVREPPEGIPLFSGESFEVGPKVALTVGTDSAIGKMTATLEIARTAREAGLSAEFVPTGQTGVVIAGWGLCVDAVVSDFVAGASEQLVLEAARTSPDLILVEGQGSLGHPAYSGVTLGLMHGSCPDCLILCSADPHEEVFRGVPRPSPARVARLYEEVASLIKPAPVVAVSLNTARLDEKIPGTHRRRRRRDRPPHSDPFRGSAAPILEAVLEAPKSKAIGL